MFSSLYTMFVLKMTFAGATVFRACVNATKSSLYGEYTYLED